MASGPVIPASASSAACTPDCATSALDKDFAADVAKLKLDLNPRTGAALEKLTKDVYGTSPALVEKLGAMLK